MSEPKKKSLESMGLLELGVYIIRNHSSGLMHRLVPHALIFVSAIPLLFYPLIFIVNTMSLAGDYAQKTFIHYLFFIYLYGGLFYPVIYILCLIVYVYGLRTRKRNISEVAASIPLISILLLFILYMLII